MIHLITLNPAIDRYIEVDRLEIGKTQYSQKITDIVGGKSVNVAHVLNNLGQPCKLVTAFEPNNPMIEQAISSLDTHIIEVPTTRVNLKINNNGEITEINSKGEALNIDACEQFTNYVIDNVTSDDIVLIAGNPHADNIEFQVELARTVKASGAKLVLDSNRFSLEHLIELAPQMAKPNDEELEQLFATEITDQNDVIKLGEELANHVSDVIVSHGSRGLTYISSDNQVFLPAFTGQAINSVGAGDSLVAGYIYGIANQYSIDAVLEIARACASASVFSGKLASRETTKDYDPHNYIS